MPQIHHADIVQVTAPVPKIAKRNYSTSDSSRAHHRVAHIMTKKRYRERKTTLLLYPLPPSSVPIPAIPVLLRLVAVPAAAAAVLRQGLTIALVRRRWLAVPA